MRIIESNNFIAVLSKLHLPRCVIPNKEYAIRDATAELIRAWIAEGKDLKFLPQWDAVSGERTQ